MLGSGSADYQHYFSGLATMDTITVLNQNLFDKQFSVPLGQLAFMFAVCFWCLLYGRYIIGLLISCFFLFYRGFISDRVYWVDLFGESYTGLLIYLFSAIAVGLMGLLAFFQESR